MKGLASALILVVSAITLSGCGGDSKPQRPTETPRPGFITPTALPRAAAGECNYADHPDAVNTRGEKPVKGDSVIKGTVTSGGEKIYFVPGMRRYGAEKVDPTAGRWFCNERDAADAGWRASASLREPLPTSTVTPTPRFGNPAATPRP